MAMAVMSLWQVRRQLEMLLQLQLRPQLVALCSLFADGGMTVSFTTNCDGENVLPKVCLSVDEPHCRGRRH